MHARTRVHNHPRLMHGTNGTDRSAASHTCTKNERGGRRLTVACSKPRPRARSRAADREAVLREVVVRLAPGATLESGCGRGAGGPHPMLDEMRQRTGVPLSDGARRDLVGWLFPSVRRGRDQSALVGHGQRPLNHMPSVALPACFAVGALPGCYLR